MRIKLVAEEETSQECIDDLITGINLLLGGKVDLYADPKRYTHSDDRKWFYGETPKIDLLHKFDAVELGGQLYFNLKHAVHRSANGGGLVVLTHHNYSYMDIGVWPPVTSPAGVDFSGTPHYNASEITHNDRKVVLLGIPNDNHPLSIALLSTTLAKTYGLTLNLPE